jgi:hypothetical protein
VRRVWYDALMSDEEWALVRSAYRDIRDAIETAADRGHDVEAWAISLIESMQLAEAARGAIRCPHGPN